MPTDRQFIRARGVKRQWGNFRIEPSMIDYRNLPELWVTSKKDRLRVDLRALEIELAREITDVWDEE